jgi:CRISPR type III-B/RAMP module RAMP protein Cmr6
LAIQLLFESSAGFQPATGSEDLGAKSKRWDDCSQLLFQIARAFGWADQDWKPGSDFAYACGEEWDEIRERATKLLFAAFPNWKKPTGNQPLWKVLPNFAGEVQFLPAYPFSAPAKDLELDVVTCHHQAYYSSTDPNKVALDTEDPIPVVFPAVAPGHVFAFAVLPGRRRGDGLLDIAKQWLKQGLETFGLGAKVAAGYGWFEVGKTSEICRIKIQDELKDKKAKADRASLQADPAVLVDLKTKNEGAMRGLVNQFQTDEQYWTNKDEKFQLSLLVFCTETDTALYEKEKANPKSKILKSLQNLAKKFGRTLP